MPSVRHAIGVVGVVRRAGSRQQEDCDFVAEADRIKQKTSVTQCDKYI